MVSAKLLSEQLAASIDPAYYLESLGFKCYEWQKEILKPGITRLILNCARQSGKSTGVSAMAVHQAKFTPGSLILIFAPTEAQAEELMMRVSEFIRADPSIILVRDSSITKKFINGSRIRAFTASPKSARGYSDPDIIIFDESAYVEDELYLTVRPMMTGGQTKLVLLSTPRGKTGFFYETWTRPSDRWTKVLVKVPDIQHITSPGDHVPFDHNEFVTVNAQKGIKAYISPRHMTEFLLEEYETMGPHWYAQEYGCEFRDPIDNVFDFDMVLSAFDTEEEAIDFDEASVLVEEEESFNW